MASGSNVFDVDMSDLCGTGNRTAAGILLPLLIVGGGALVFLFKHQVLSFYKWLTGPIVFEDRHFLWFGTGMSVLTWLCLLFHAFAQHSAKPDYWDNLHVGTMHIVRIFVILALIIGFAVVGLFIALLFDQVPKNPFTTYATLGLLLEAFLSFLAMCCLAAMFNDCFSQFDGASKGKSFVLLVMTWFLGFLGTFFMFIPAVKDNESEGETSGAQAHQGDLPNTQTTGTAAAAGDVWERHTDDEGTAYLWNPRTGESKWAV